MKKRFVAAIVAAALAAGTLPAAGAVVDSGEADAYLKAMDNMPNASSYLVDFDGDGSDELLLVQKGISGPAPNNQYSIWVGEQLVAEQNDWIYFLDGAIYCKDGDKNQYLVLQGAEAVNSYFRAYTIQNDTWNLAAELTVDYNPTTDKETCSINGIPVTYAEYMEAKSSYISQYTISADGHSVRSELLAALDTGADGYKDVLSSLSASERKALFDDFLYCVAGVDGGNSFPGNPSRGFDSRTASDGEIVSLLESLRMDTRFPISGDPFPQADFTKLTQRYFGRTIDYSKFAIDHQPTGMDYGYNNVYYNGVFYLCWPQRGSNVSLEGLSGTPKQLYSLGGNWYCANFTISIGCDYSAVVKRNTDGTWQLVRLYPANYVPSDAELAAFTTPSSWAQAEVSAADAAGLIPALDGDPSWQDSATRLQFAQLAVRLAETVTGKTLPAAANSTFTDCTNLDVRKAYAAGIVNGTSETTFSPYSKLTREQLATMLWRAAGYIQQQTGEQVLIAGGSLTGYADAGRVSAYAKEAVTSLAKYDIMQGTSNTQLSPQDSCTVEQSVLLAYRMMQKLNGV